MRIDRVKFITELARRNLTAKQLSELSGVSAVTISNIRSGKNCRDDVGAKLAGALGVAVESLTEQEVQR